MPDIDNRWPTWEPRALSVLRFVAGLIFLDHGTAKLLAFPAMDRFTSQMDRRQRRRACSIDRDARSIEIEQIGNPVGDRPRQSSWDCPIAPAFLRQCGIVVTRDADKYTDISRVFGANRTG